MFCKKRTINELDCKEIDTVFQNVCTNGDKPWSQVKILVVDDQEFAHTDRLQRDYGFNVRWMKDITPDIAKDFDIVLCDQEGVGVALNKTTQGGALAKEIKQRFPMKFVVLYTSSGKSLGNFDIIKAVDSAISPGGDLDDFAQTLKSWCMEVVDPKKRWCRLRNIFLEKGISIHDVAKMEDQLVRAWNKNPQQIDKALIGRLGENVAAGLLVEFLKYLAEICVPLFAL